MAVGNAAKKPGPNDKCSCGSGAKAKKCCNSAAAEAAKPGGDCVLPGSVDELWPMAKAAEKNNDLGRAAHLYTMAINAAATGMKRDQDGAASDADLLACEKKTEGKLSQVLLGRAQLYLRQGNGVAAIEDADTCTRANPQFEQGYCCLAKAHEAVGAPLQLQLEACERGLASCPDSEYLVTAKWRLKKTIHETPDEVDAQNISGMDTRAAVKETRRQADDASDPRHAIAAADWGSILATGAHGMEKDVEQAERYLRIGADSGDVAAQRNLGLLLLEQGQPVEASGELNKAAGAGDEHAAEVLQHLAHEADAKRKQALARLEEMAADGDPRAMAMLQELRMGEE